MSEYIYISVEKCVQYLSVNELFFPLSLYNGNLRYTKFYG